MNNVFVAKLLLAIEEHHPKGATGIYITAYGIHWGFRTNQCKFPSNFVPFMVADRVGPALWHLRSAVDEAMGDSDLLIDDDTVLFAAMQEASRVLDETS